MERRSAIKIGGALVIILVAATLLLAQRGYSPVADEIHCICVETGREYFLSTSKIRGFPAPNPKTERRTLLPCERRGDRLFLLQRFAGVLEALGEKNKYVDPESLAIQSTG